VGEPANVLTPASLRGNYRKEIGKFVAPPGEGKYQVSSYDQAGKGTVAPKPVFVADEVQRLRNQGKAYEGAMDLARRSDKRVLLSATPLVNRPGDLASIINLMHGKQLYDPDSFEDRFVGSRVHRPFLNLFGKATVEPTIEHEDELKGLLKDRVHYVPGADETKPTVTEREVPVPMSRLQNNLNRTLLNKAPLWVRWKIRHNLPADRQESPQLNAFLSGMRQVSLSPYTFDRRLAPLDAFKQSPKLQQAFTDTQTVLKKPTGKVMVFSNFPTTALEPYAAALDKAGVTYSRFDGSMSDAQRKAAVDAYNAGRVRVVLLGPAGSEGISLRGTTNIQTLDPHWNQARIDQAEARGVRIDSHIHLPADQRHVDVSRYVSEPRTGLIRRLLRMPAPVGADRYLYTRSEEKQKQLNVLQNYLQQVGQLA
jgi:SNF2 family DNA or RNA helicase